MCYFPKRVNPISSAYNYGITEFECGWCPECLRKKANRWVPRAYYESKEHKSNIMICLTYDQYIHDSKTGRIVGERVADDMCVNVRDIQLFIKRVRKKYGKGIKYLCGAEYGAHTHRPHYHIILFGVDFGDYRVYKKSKRGNLIYRSAELEKLWKNGICTVDSLNVNGAVSRYCTKYCAKDRSNGTFMLFSQRMGFKGMKDSFNGLYYMVEGNEYPVPRLIWNEYIYDKYKDIDPSISYKYVPLTDKTSDYYDDSLGLVIGEYHLNRVRNLAFRECRDSDPEYQSYLLYWKTKIVTHPLLSVEERIRSLPFAKYGLRKQKFLDFLLKHREVEALRASSSEYKYHLPFSSCLLTASDTNFGKRRKFTVKSRQIIRIFEDFGDNPFDNPQKNLQKQLTFLEPCDNINCEVI